MIFKQNCEFNQSVNFFSMSFFIVLFSENDEIVRDENNDVDIAMTKNK